MKIKIILISVVLFFNSVACLAQSTKPAENEKKSLESLRQKVVELAVKGEVTDELFEAYRQFAVEQVKESTLLEADLDEDFWRWVSANKILNQYLAISIIEDENYNALLRLKELRDKFAAQVDSHPQLAMAFAIYYGRGGVSKNFTRYPKARLQTIPSMTDSFEYYIKNESQMKISLKAMPWQILILLAENVVPISERLWALDYYKDADSGTIGQKALSDMKYQSINWHPKNNPENRPKTLQNLLKYGGICGKRSNYANGVCKALGVPAVRAGIPGHAWVAWLGRKNNRLDIHEFGEYRSSYYGWLISPVTGKETFVENLRFMIYGLSGDYERYMKAITACYAYDLVLDERKIEGVNVLKKALKTNFYCEPIWQRLAVAYSDGHLSQSDGIRIFGSMLKKASGFSGMIYSFQEKLYERWNDKKINLSLANIVFRKTLQNYEKNYRPDLSLRAMVLHMKYLEKISAKQTLKHCVNSLRYFCVDNYFKPEPNSMKALDTLFKTTKKISNSDLSSNRWMKFMDSFVSEMINLNKPARIEVKRYVISEYVNSLSSAGRNQDAIAWYELLVELNKKNSKVISSIEAKLKNYKGKFQTKKINVPDRWADVIVNGRGFQEETFEEGKKAFLNRKYVWEQIPQEFSGWTYTMAAGGKNPSILVKAINAGRVVVAFCDDKGTEAVKFLKEGWIIDESRSFFYKNKKMKMRTLYKNCQTNEEIQIPQLSWSGTIVLIPKRN